MNIVNFLVRFYFNNIPYVAETSLTSIFSLNLHEQAVISELFFRNLLFTNHIDERRSTLLRSS